MWSELKAPRMAGIITAIGPPKLGMNCRSPARMAQTGAHGIPIIKRPASQSSATASESWHWAINQCFSADPVVRACERQSRQSMSLSNHRVHRGSRRNCCGLSRTGAKQGNKTECGLRTESENLCVPLCSLWLNENMKFGVIIFPGSNCDQDSYHAAIAATRQKAAFLWHESHELENCDAIIVPGGFAYGDYLRTGAIARFAPIMQEVGKFAASGGLVIGICNGFQILCEAGLLPGALMRNAGLKYVCKFVNLRVDNADTPFSNSCKIGEVLRIP